MESVVNRDSNQRSVGTRLNQVATLQAIQVQLSQLNHQDFEGDRSEVLLHCEAQLASILERDSFHLGALELVSKCYWHQERYVAVIDTVKKMLAINPDETGYQQLKAMSLRALGNYGEAAKILSRLPGSDHLLNDLEAFQAKCVKDLLEREPEFQREFASNQIQALESRGFYFKNLPLAVQWIREKLPANQF